MPLLADIDYDENEYKKDLDWIKRQPNLTIETAVERLADAYVDRFNLEGDWQINQGLCENFAQDIAQIFPDAKTLWDDQLDPNYPGSHCVIHYQEYYYDAECPEGIEDWTELPYFQRHPLTKINL